MARFVTVTPNPALDLTLEVACLQVGGVNVASLSRFDSGGKGANVARMLAQLLDRCHQAKPGVRTVKSGPLGRIRAQEGPQPGCTWPYQRSVRSLFCGVLFRLSA